MMRHATRILRGRGLSDGRIWLSLERNMHCALGVCGHCQLGPFLLCRDGPIFRSSQIRPFFEIENL
jgi:NAD(P)H-flavin reductase